MSAYIVYIRNRTHDPAGLARYAELVKASPAAKCGLEVIASRESKFQLLEGHSEAEFAVILRFPTMEDARTWYDSDEYKEAISIRQGVADSQVFIVEGND